MQTKILKEKYQVHQQLITKRQEIEAQFTDPESPYVKFKTDINFPDISGNTLLHYAAALGNLLRFKSIVHKKKSRLTVKIFMAIHH